MKQYSNNEVYFLGGNKYRIKKKRTWLYTIILSVFILITMIALFIPTQDINKENVTENVQHNELQTINILPENAKAPLFMGKYPIEDFLSWISKEIKYPKGEELQDAMVIVSFVITTKGKLDSIKIISQPKEKSFGLQVIRILRKCPKWEPGRLANGAPADIRYILPIKFNRARKFN